MDKMIHKRFSCVYIYRGKVETSTVGYGIEFGKDIEIKIPVHKLATTFTIKVPTLLTRSSEGDEAVSELKVFFQNQNGSIAVSQAICSTHKVDLILAARKKRFTQPFLDSIVGLQTVSEVSLLNLVRLIDCNDLKLFLLIAIQIKFQHHICISI